MDTNDKANINSLASRNIPSAKAGNTYTPIKATTDITPQGKPITRPRQTPYNVDYNKMADQQKAEHQKWIDETTPYEPWEEEKKPAGSWAKDTIAKMKDKQNLKADDERAKYEKTPVEYPRNELPTGGGEQSLDDKIHGINYLQEGADLGEKASKVIQDVDIPKYKRATFKDLMYDPQWEGKRDSLIGNAIGTALGSGLARTGGTDLGAESALSKYNKEQMENYSAMQANKDQSALDANLSDITTLNAQKVAMEANLADTIANTYIERYNTLQTNETKRQLVNQMVKDSDKLFNDPNLLGGKDSDKKILNLATLMGLYAGDFSISARLIQKYAPRLIATFEQVMNKATNGKWSDWTGDPNTENPDADEADQPEKKNEEEVAETPVKYPTIEGGRPIDAKNYEKKPDDYIIIPQLDGTSLYVHKNKDWSLEGEGLGATVYHYNPDLAEKQKIADAILKSNLPNDQKLLLATDWQGGYYPTDKNTVTGMVAEGVWKEKKKDEEIKNYNSNTLKAINTEKNNLYTGKDPQKTLDWIAKNPLNTEYADTITKSQYEGLVENAHKQKIDKQLSTIGSSNWSDERKIKEYTDLKETEGQYMDQQTKTDIQRKIQNAETQLSVYKPYIEATNNALSKIPTDNDSYWTINNNGTIQYKWGSKSVSPYPTGEIDPATFDFGQGQSSQDFFNTFVTQLDPEVVASNLPGSTTKDKNTYFYTTGVYKIMRGLVNNDHIKGLATAKNGSAFANPKIKESYDKLKDYWKLANSGRYFSSASE